MTMKKFIPVYAFCITAALIVTTLGSVAMAGLIIEVTNSGDQDWILSDLIVYGDNNQKNTILKLNDASDDITLGAKGSRTFDAGFEVKKYFVSTIVGGSEFESIVLKVKQVGPKELGFFVDPNSNFSLFAALDYDLAVAPPPIGTILDFTDGLSQQLPGWFIGTGADFDIGDVTGAFTGQARVVLNEVQAAAVPEPSSLTLLGLGLVGFLMLSWARKRKLRLRQ